jgi:hypothetical protein
MICPRRFGYRYILGLVPFQLPKPLALGTCVHEALAAHYAGKAWEQALDAVERKAAYMAPTARKIVEAYLKEYAFERLDVRFVEKELFVTLRGFAFTRRVDLGYQKHGKLWIMDHKTAGDQRTRLATTKFDATLFTQAIVGKALSHQETGLPFGGVVLNLLGTREPHKFQRVTMEWTPTLMNDALDSLFYWSREAKGALIEHQTPWKFPQTWQCQGRYQLCEYLPLCLYGKQEVVNYDREEV